MLRAGAAQRLQRSLRRISARFNRRPHSTKPELGNEPLQKPASSASRRGPVTWRSLAVATGVGVGVGFVYWQQKERKVVELERQAAAQASAASAGKPAIGGPFRLVDARTQREVTDADFRGRFPLIYFGFTHCPDVCPDEITKISKALALLDKRVGRDRLSATLVPLFVSVDPERDTPAAMNEFLSNEDFDGRFVGLTGSAEQCAAAAKAFRVYYMKTDESESDYLVDHSIITYLMGPDGSLLDYFGKNVSAEEMALRIERHLQQVGSTAT
ncbi:Cu-binding protein [Cyanidiococcus yangmingshanensis]|uniref:Cu-binding protein n=1 Tax=Cyanidiococcus yangmingshanensis TaxID=2690220 RepID=A0A7J7IDT5_9RHOD|nr:Cu-binding protein [Cyanidiococcus yangmingshanensis]